MADADHLTERQRKYVEHFIRSLDSQAAADAAGYSPSFRRVAAYRLGKVPTIARAIASIRSEARRIACYDVTTAMQEALDVVEFAKSKGNAMAFCKAVELRARLSGLLVERVEVKTINLIDAITAAERRLSNGVNVLPPPAPRSRQWIPIPAGDEVA